MSSDIADGWRKVTRKPELDRRIEAYAENGERAITTVDAYLLSKWARMRRSPPRLIAWRYWDPPSWANESAKKVHP